MKRIVGHDSLPEEELWIRHFPDESFDDRATGAGFKRAEGSTRCLEDSKGKEHLACHADLFRDNTRGIARPYSSAFGSIMLHPYVSEITNVSPAA